MRMLKKNYHDNNFDVFIGIVIASRGVINNGKKVMKIFDAKFYMNKDQRFKLKQSLQLQVEKCYRNKADIHPSHHSLFQESVEDMCSKKSIQHLRCWIHSYHVAEAYSI